jgi:S-adenosylmethionine:tRNA ribosyltransferase-isomerase
MLTADFDYHLPPELIASEPLADRSASRMMVHASLHRANRASLFREIAQFLLPGDLLVLNNTRVVPARFFTDKGHEVLRLKPLTPTRWRCMVRRGKSSESATSADRRPPAAWSRSWRKMATASSSGIASWMRTPTATWPSRTTWAATTAPGPRTLPEPCLPGKEGSIAAPTAGLHFTPEILKPLPHAFVTLHVGVGTFQPVKAEKIADHVMHHEEYEVSPKPPRRFEAAKRVICVGTTSLRTLESVARDRWPRRRRSWLTGHLHLSLASSFEPPEAC